MGVLTYLVTGHADAPVETVWDLLADARRWPEWTWVRRGAVEREGDPPPNGLGSVRRLGLAPFASREEIVAWDPPTHLGYTMLAGMPVRAYRADVHLDQSAGGGTDITWSGSFVPLVAGSGALMQRVLHGIIKSFMRGLTAHAATIGASGGASA